MTAPRQSGPARFMAAILLLGSSVVMAEDRPEQPEEARAALEALRAEIQGVTRQLEEDRGELSDLQAQLRDSEQRLGSLNREMTENREAIDATRSELAQLQARRTELEARLDQQRAHIAEQLRAVWRQGREPEIKLLLNQEDPQTVARSLAYHRYILRARQERVEAFRTTLGELEEVAESIENRNAELESRRETLAAQRDVELALQAERARVVASLDADIVDRNRRLERLQQERAELEQLLEALEQAALELALPADARPFTEARGELDWPVPGKRANSFGGARGSGDLRWQGINLLAEAGTPVRAIHHGRVVYADWLRGLGLLLILDHGDGYMSLYGHNQSLLREVGEWVKAGTPVSTVGTSGGLQSPALYFEIRQQGKPVDPVNWCR